ncbi:MAG: hypothetical protein WBC91_05345 [Phototrophicaceae bacterium]
MQLRKQSLYFMSIMSAIIFFVSACSPLSSNDVALTNTFESNAFALNYPDEWQYQIPQVNMLFLASPEILAQQAGATVTLQRSIALSSSANTLSAALNSYLERGPLRSDRNWERVGEIESVEIDTYEAVLAVVEGAEEVGTLPMRSEIYVLQANSGFYFIFTLTAPIDQWDTLTSIFDAMKNSVDIRE